jgi:ATP-dependent DNA helicase RecG (EC 3.6.1.-)
MTVFGELDVSVINELPANRVPVKTAIRGESALGGIYDFIRTSVRAGRQAFIVYPLVEDV